MIKPCEIVRTLPCHGAEGTCFGRVYWGGKPFSDASGAANKHKRRAHTSSMDACRWIERANGWWERSEEILGISWTPEERLAWETQVRADPYKPHLRARLDEEEQPEEFIAEAEEEE